MTKSFAFNPHDGQFSIKGEFTIYQVRTVRENLLKALASGACKRVDLNGVSDFDSAALQLILALRRGFPEVELSMESESVAQVFGLLNLPADDPCDES